MEDNEQIPVFYVNSMEFESGQYDLTVYIGQRDSEAKITRTAKLIMAWPHAKKVVEVLNNQVKIYEEMYGQVFSEPNPEKIEELQKSGVIVVHKMEK